MVYGNFGGIVAKSWFNLQTTTVQRKSEQSLWLCIRANVRVKLALGIQQTLNDKPEALLRCWLTLWPDVLWKPQSIVSDTVSVLRHLLCIENRWMVIKHANKMSLSNNALMFAQTNGGLWNGTFSLYCALQCLFILHFKY